MNPGELPPLTQDSVPEIVSLLSRSLSTVSDVQKQCEKALKALENRENFASCLLEVLFRREQVDRSARWLASVYLKNVIARNWRTRLQCCILPEEKCRLREGLFGLIDEPDGQIGVQVGLAVSKIARFDYPKDWPDLVERLMGMISETRALTAGEQKIDSNIVLHRAYLTLHLVLKELSSKRLAADQKNFEELCSALYDRLVTWWVEDCDQVVCGRIRVPEDVLVLELKCMRRVVVLGFPGDAKTLVLVDRVRELFPFLVKILDAFMRLDSSSRFSLKLLKMLHETQETHCWAFAASGSLLPYIELLCAELSRQGDIQCTTKHKRVLRALYSVVKCPGYRGSTASLLMPAGRARELKQLLERMSSEIGETLKNFWCNEDKDVALLSLLVQRYFPLTPEELALWEANGEEFHHELEHAAKEETVRGCAEMLYVALLESNRRALAPVVARMMHQCCSVELGVENACLHSAAVIHAVALGAYELYDYIDFDEILRGLILPMMSGVPAASPCVRREALRLVSYWIAKLKPNNRFDVYKMLISVLQEKDSAMYLMACSALQAVMEDWDFDVELFRPLASDTARLLIDNLARSSDYESQLEIFCVLNLVIDHLQERAMDCAPSILHMIPQLWQDSEGQGLLRIQILLALQRLVHALGSESPVTYPVVLPILQFVINDKNIDPMNALEDGILLCIVVLRHAPGRTQGLLAPMESMLSIMKSNSEHIFTGTRCISSIALLFGDDFLETHGRKVNDVLGGYSGNLRDKALSDIVQCLDTIVQACPRHGLSCLADAIVGFTLDVLNPQRGNQVVAPFLALIISRVTIKNPIDLLQLIDYACRTRTADVQAALDCQRTTDSPVFEAGISCEEKLFARILDLWIDKFDSIAPKGMRKLAALGLCSLLKLNKPVIAQRFAEILSNVSAVYTELEHGENIDAMSLSFSVAGIGPRDDMIAVSVDLEEAEGESARRQALFDKSPISTLSIKESFRSCISQIDVEVITLAIEALDVPSKKMLHDLLE
jgi:hypothetical protein